ncbi:MAG: DUF366 family protein [Candidatus Gastranaerophilales bacterium]|nr:DUF366 family protein [Candidatus Gastranaerophilales bacterium]
MEKLFIKKEIKYDGRQLSPHWIYKNFGLRGDSIVCFKGGADVKLTEMVDIEDVINNEPIKSDKMANFIIEVFNSNLREAIFRQRLFISIIKETLEDAGIIVKRRGDDLFYENKKLSVSIATKSTVSTLIHTGINLVSAGAPIQISSISDMKIINEDCFIEEVMERFCIETNDIEFAKAKVRGV